MNELIETYKSYTQLLTDELNEAVGMAAVHGWKSSRYDKGKELRDKIQQLSEVVEQPKTDLRKQIENLIEQYSEHIDLNQKCQHVFKNIAEGLKFKKSAYQRMICDLKLILSKSNPKPLVSSIDNKELDKEELLEKAKDNVSKSFNPVSFASLFMMYDEEIKALITEYTRLLGK